MCVCVYVGILPSRPYSFILPYLPMRKYVRSNVCMLRMGRHVPSVWAPMSPNWNYLSA